ncbi:MAG: hypothetical protein IJ087_18190, partial [Eggerthellaceae bacterium]|nr:hypothetical protein [Eggerthellaceae bacterium]
AVLWKGGEWEYIAAPRRRNPGRKQTCTMFTWADVVAFENADRALCAGNSAEASLIAEGIGSATLRNAIAEGLERLEAEMAVGQIEAQFAEIAEPEPKPEPAPVDELAQVHMLLGSPDNVAVTQKRPGCCIWVSGDTKPHRETLKDFGFRWSPKRSAWYWKPQAA